jgi:cytoskeletal protein CcmA (bactofilin family)
MVKFTNGNVNGTDGNELASKSPISLPHRAHVSGDVTSSDSVTLENDSVVDGDVTSGSDTILKHRVKVYGSVCSNGNLELQHDSEIFGNATAHGYAILNQRSKIYGNLIASDYVELQNDAEVAGNIDAVGTVSIDKRAEVGGRIVSDSDILIDGLVKDDVYSYGNVIVGKKGTVQGSVYSAGYVSHPGAVEGSIYEGMDPDDLPSVSEPKNCTSEIMFPELNSPCTGEGVNEPVDNDEDVSLSPGTYGNISVKGGYIITLHDGVDYYCVDSLDMGNNSILRLDLSGGEEEGITFFSANGIGIKNDFNIQVSEDGSEYVDIEDADEQLARRVYFEAHEDVTIGNNGEFFGTLLVGGSLDVGQNGAVVIGAFYVLGESVDLGNDIDMTYVPSNYASEHWYK